MSFCVRYKVQNYTTKVLTVIYRCIIVLAIKYTAIHRTLTMVFRCQIVSAVKYTFVHIIVPVVFKC